MFFGASELKLYLYRFSTQVEYLKGRDDTQHNNKNATLSIMTFNAYAECCYVDCRN